MLWLVYGSQRLQFDYHRRVRHRDRTKQLLLAMVAMTVSALGHAQTQSDAPPAAFEVASIKPASIPIGHEGGNRSRVEYTPTSLTMLNVDLRDCVQWASGVASFQIADAHASPVSYDILAKSAVPCRSANSGSCFRIYWPKDSSSHFIARPGCYPSTSWWLRSGD
jgi:hypothetical protein